MEPLVTIAIPDMAGPTVRTATLNSLARYTPEPYEVVLLVEEARRQNVSSGSDNQVLRQISVAAPFGTPLLNTVFDPKFDGRQRSIDDAGGASFLPYLSSPFSYEA